MTLHARLPLPLTFVHCGPADNHILFAIMPQLSPTNLFYRILCAAEQYAAALRTQTMWCYLMPGDKLVLKEGECDTMTPSRSTPPNP